MALPEKPSPHAEREATHRSSAACEAVTALLTLGLHHEILADRAGIHEKTLRELPMKISISQDHHE